MSIFDKLFRKSRGPRVQDELFFVTEDVVAEWWGFNYATGQYDYRLIHLRTHRTRVATFDGDDFPNRMEILRDVALRTEW